jgi:hypothetical protein
MCRSIHGYATVVAQRARSRRCGRCEPPNRPKAAVYQLVRTDCRGAFGPQQFSYGFRTALLDGFVRIDKKWLILAEREGFEPSKGF